MARNSIPHARYSIPEKPPSALTPTLPVAAEGVTATARAEVVVVVGMNKDGAAVSSAAVPKW